jgi:Protein of unknown function DUF115/Methyltransferase domain
MIAAGARGFAPQVLIQPMPEAPGDGYVGHAPSVMVAPIPAKPAVDENPEAARYRRMWDFDVYRAVSPGEEMAMTFLAQARPPADAECIDFGCGTGRGALMLALLGGMRVTMLDFADNCLDPEVRQALVTQSTRLSFRLADLTVGSPVAAPYGYCCDVMEHIPTEDVPKVLSNILKFANHVFFSISTVPDVCGPGCIGEPLHLTVRPMSWWISELSKLGAVVHWSEESEGGCAIYCSSWKDADELIKGGSVNVGQDAIDAQVAANVRAGWKQATPYDRQDREVVLLAGGPSLSDHIDEIRRLRAEGAALITTNGSYNWALDQGLRPSMQIVVDAREFNSRFTHPVSDDCLYMLASQVHASTLEGLPRERTFLWHSGISEANEALVREVTGQFFFVPGGSTVVLRAIPLLRMLGFWRMHIFGFDSCARVRSGAHHAYPQSENDGEPVVPVICGGHQFWCTPWMVSQASEFRSLVKGLGDEVELAVYGDGLIAQIVKTGASFSTIEE